MSISTWPNGTAMVCCSISYTFHSGILPVTFNNSNKHASKINWASITILGCYKWPFTYTSEFYFSSKHASNIHGATVTVLGLYQWPFTSLAILTELLLWNWVHGTVMAPVTSYWWNFWYCRILSNLKKMPSFLLLSSCI